MTKYGVLKETPEHFCAYCGKMMVRKRSPKGKMEDINTFMRRKYCNRECMRKAFVKKDATTQRYGCAHASARRIIYMLFENQRVCELCGKTTSIDVHHKDGDYNNNTKSNLMVVCRSCHMKLHHPKSVCRLCGKPAKGHGLCNMHLIRMRKYGNPLVCNGKIVDSDYTERKTDH